MNENASLKPKDIVFELNKFIIGQDDAKRQVAIALRNRMRRMKLEKKIRDEVVLSNIIMIGPTGVGKTEIARRLSNLVKAPFVKVEATKFTEVGYVGKDVESIIRDLMVVGYNLVESEMSLQLEESVKEAIRYSLLEAVFPGFSGFEESTKEKFERMLDDNALEEREVEIEVQEKGGPSIDIFGMGGMDALEPLQEMISQMAPKKKRRKKMRVKDAREILKEIEISKRIDKDKVIDMARERVENQGIVFIDEIDKIISTGSNSNAEVSRSGVQRDLLPIVEGTNVMTKYGQVRTDHILFISAGAFTNVSISDLMPELQGRFPIRTELSPLSKEDFILILTKPDNAIIKQYQHLMLTDGINVEFTDDAIDFIADAAYQANQRIEDIGARRLRTIISKVMEDIMFEAPDIESKNVIIDSEYVKKHLGSIFGENDRRKYIL